MLAKALKIILGIIFVALGAYSIYLWWADLLLVIRGSVGLILILVGLIAFALVAD